MWHLLEISVEPEVEGHPSANVSLIDSPAHLVHPAYGQEVDLWLNFQATVFFEARSLSLAM